MSDLPLDDPPEPIIPDDPPEPVVPQEPNPT